MYLRDSVASVTKHLQARLPDSEQSGGIVQVVAELSFHVLPQATNTFG